METGSIDLRTFYNLFPSNRYLSMKLNNEQQNYPQLDIVQPTLLNLLTKWVKPFVQNYCGGPNFIYWLY